MSSGEVGYLGIVSDVVLCFPPNRFQNHASDDSGLDCTENESGTKTNVTGLRQEGIAYADDFESLPSAEMSANGK